MNMKINCRVTNEIDYAESLNEKEIDSKVP